MARQDEAQPVAPALVGMSQEQLAALLTALKSDDDALLQKKAQYDAEAMKKALRPENEQAPGISVFSYPEGELAHPKEPLKCEIFWVGFPETLETLTVQEARLLNALVDHTAKVGGKDYVVRKTDGDPMKVTVSGDTNVDGTLRRMEIYFPCRGELRHNLPSKASMLREMLGEQEPDIAAMQDELERLRKIAREREK